MVLKTDSTAFGLYRLYIVHCTAKYVGNCCNFHLRYQYVNECIAMALGFQWHRYSFVDRASGILRTNLSIEAHLETLWQETGPLHFQPA